MLNLDAIKNWVNNTQLIILENSDLPDEPPGQLVGIESIPIPTTIIEERVRGYAGGCPIYGPVTINRQQIADAYLYNQVASVLRIDDGVYYVPVTDGDGDAFWYPLNEESEGWRVVSTFFTDKWGYCSACSESGAIAMASRLREWNPGYTFDVVYKQRQVTECEWRLK
jgi:hypothetical protein